MFEDRIILFWSVVNQVYLEQNIFKNWQHFVKLIIYTLNNETNLWSLDKKLENQTKDFLFTFLQMCLVETT